MSLLKTILDHNEQFVASEQYKKYETTKFPDKKLVILTCMDTRLHDLLPAAMNIKQGDAKVIKNAGAVISHPFGSVMRSILVALYALKADEVMIIGHHQCGMAGLESSNILDLAESRGVNMDSIKDLEFVGVDIDQFLTGFQSVEESVEHSVSMVRKHPLMPDDVPVHGLVIHPETGKLDLVSSGYKL
ncbi:beta-class carbonic anhydrase [Halalkalibacter hemicellulosilyticus]|uniref:beta-class carbonic anhydrase n=1 Tax=Halalkalibacter hemicellulosilyticus TaxID=127886 RepID=UPI00054CEE63|nr:carbonic anhydrase [Halalkalibacter hemicellulosilyticus]